MEEFGSGAVGADPIAPAQQVVNFAGNDYLLKRHLLGAQLFDQIGGLPEWHVSTVVAMLIWLPCLSAGAKASQNRQENGNKPRLYEHSCGF